MGETPEWDAISARFCKLEMPTAGEVMDLFGAYGKLLIERDTLAAELAALRAGLPRWKQDDDGLAFRLTVGPIERWVEPCANGWRAPFLGVLAQDRDTAMKVLTDSLGLPPCEVEGE
jgi:hypothetical protein